MYTDALKLTAAATKHGAVSALETLERTGWTPEDFQHLIMHQTSSTALASAMREINRLMKRRVCHQGNTIDNLERRGNTASTSHFVALSDNLANGRIKSGDRVIFAISGSGITVGTALYTFDDLPDRLRTPSNGNISTHAVTKRTGRHVVRHSDARVRIESVGTALNNSGPRLDSLALLGRAADDCLTLSSHDRDTLDLLIYAGVYRTDFVCEPAIAAMLAGAQNINSSLASAGERRTLAFDVFNGGVGFLNACHVATEFVRSGKVATAMIASADVENNTDVFPDERLGIEESASAVVLDIAPGGRSGFGSFCFRSFTEHADGFSSHATNKEGRLYLHFSRAADLERHYVDGVASTVSDFLEANDLNIGSISRVFASQISASFLDCIGRALRIEQDRIVNAIPAGRDLLTSSIPFAFRQSVERAPAMPGEIGLVISAGSGVQIGCALYYF
jgi:3-oxoacyl-[acyl-carrier-protein] synthase III